MNSRKDAERADRPGPYGPNSERVAEALAALERVDRELAQRIADARQAVPSAEWQDAQGAVQRLRRDRKVGSQLEAAEARVADWLTSRQPRDDDEAALFADVADAARDAVDAMVLVADLGDADFAILCGPWREGTGDLAGDEAEAATGARPSATRYCNQCGAEASTEDIFCGRCGTRLAAVGIGATAAIEPLAIQEGPGYAIAALLAAGAIAIGSFLPWASAGAGLFKASGSGIEGGDGWITLAIGAAAAVVAIQALLRSQRPHPVLMISAGTAALAMAILEVVNILNRPGTSLYGVQIKASPDLGLLAIASGGIGLVVVAFAVNRS